MTTQRVGSPVHLRGGGVSLVLDPIDVAGRLPTVRHWGADLGQGAAVSGSALAHEPPIAHSAPDEPVRRRLLPMPVDGWRLRPGLRGSRPDGGGWSPRFVVQQTVVEGRTEVRFAALDDVAGLQIVITLHMHPSGVLEMQQQLRNLGDSPFAIVELAATLPLPAQPLEVLDPTGRWGKERAPQRHVLPYGSWLRESRRGRPGHDAPLVVSVGLPGFSFRAGEVWAAHLGWSGDSTYWVERNPQGLAQLGAAELLAPGEVVLAPGDAYPAPPLYATYSDEGLDGVSRAYHRFLRARRSHPGSPRPVILNTWEAVYFDHDLDRLKQLAAAAAAVGVERFVLDDGWFGGRRNDRAGLGDWFVSAQAWPAGLTPLITHVGSLGMDFGLWVEPEMVNPDSDLYRAHPDWVLSRSERTPPSWRHQQLLDLANPEVHAHLLERLHALLRDHDIAFLKWDHNRDLIDAEHDGRPGVHAQTRAVYDLLDELRRLHPGVEIESCASGGARVDLGILARTDRVWPSDTNDALERQTVQRWTGQLLPPELIGAHVGPPKSHTTGRSHSLSFRVATAFFGHLGIEWDITTATTTELDGLREAIDCYKRLRHLLHGGDVVRADHVDPAAYVHGVVAPDRSEAVFAFVQLASCVAEIPGPIRLIGLAAERDYRVTPLLLAGGPQAHEIRPPAWVAAGGVTASGRVLEVVGLQVPILVPEQALLLHLVAEPTGSVPTPA